MGFGKASNETTARGDRKEAHLPHDELVPHPERTQRANELAAAGHSARYPDAKLKKPGAGS